MAVTSMMSCITCCKLWFCFFRLVGDILLATSFLSYSGPFNQDFRFHLLTIWKRELKKRQVPYSADLNITSMLVDAATVCVNYVML